MWCNGTRLWMLTVGRRKDKCMDGRTDGCKRDKTWGHHVRRSFHTFQHSKDCNQVSYWTFSTFFNRRGTSCVQVVFFLTFTDKLTESASAPWHFDTLAFMAFDKWWVILQGHKAIFKTFQNTCSQAHHVPIEGTCALYLHLPSVLELEPWGLCQRTSAFSILFSICSYFSRMRSKGSRFTLGVWGLRVGSLDVAFTSATVRNRPYELRMAVPMGSFAEVVLFGGFRRLVASFRVAGVALRDIQTCSATCRKSLRVAGAILLRRFQKMCCSFRGRRSTLDVSIVIFRGRRSTLDVSFCVFFVNRIGRAASSGDKVQIPWQAWHFVRCVENWRKPRTKHRFWGCQFSGSKENS